MISIIALWMECPGKLYISHRNLRLAPEGPLHHSHMVWIAALLELKDGPVLCWLRQVPPVKDWLVRVHHLTSETYCSTLNIKLGSKLPSVDKNIFGVWCNIKWHSRTQAVHTVWFYLWKEKSCRKMTGRNRANMVTVVAPTDGTLDNL